MFQTEPIHALQSLASPALTALLDGVTYLGYGASFFVLVVAVTFGVDFRRGFVLMQVLAWTSLLLYAVKNAVDLPRPYAVDRTVRLLGEGAENVAAFERMGAPGFWAGLPPDVVAHHRAAADASQGFPSGHVAATTACWGTLALLFRRPWLTACAAALVALMPVSRMYLGVHFLADVLGGLLLGGLVLSAAYGLVLRPERLARFLSLLQEGAAALVAGGPARFYLFALPLLVLLVPAVRPEDAARLLGLNVGFFLVARRGLPVWRGGAASRVGRVALALALYATAGYGLHRAARWVFASEPTVWAFVAEAAAVAGMLVGTVAAVGWGAARRTRQRARPAKQSAAGDDS